MNLDRKLHIVAISSLVGAIVIGGVSYLLDGVVFWIMIGIAVLLVVVGMYFASRAGAEQRKREEAGRH
ncbi:MAG: hypothetical protein JW990_11035 [Thermoleophilia bacterium]|nr:hypothetical protein [Thermoleophilia bacterium]